MGNMTRLAVGASAALGFLAWVLPLPASAAPVAAGADRAVFVQTDNPAGNQLVAYDRSSDGTLAWEATYDTGGLGGVLSGSVVDHLASQGSLAYDAGPGLVLAVNAGSNTVSVFSVNGDDLALRQVVGSGGTFPASIAVSGGLVYVLNAEDGGSVSGFRVAGGRLHAIPGSTRALGLTTPTDTSQFTHTPGQVAFSPDGSQLVVTTKAASNAIDVFAVAPSGRLSADPVVNSEPGAVPFAVSWDAAGHLVVAEAGTNAVATFALDDEGTLAPIDSVATGQAATCWVARARGYFFASNAGSPSVSGVSADGAGQLTLLGATTTDPGAVDAAAAAGGHYLYVQSGGPGAVDEFAVHSDGSLTTVGSVTVPGAAGGEGILAF
ncbi:MAG TPA: beta-propeller fold lactonase family protein [Actinomycetota bacterium]|nr:beta-propeller fold lactonase family protein [Actinomycetota bacterium]